jgi:5,10-methylenetetrahydromethanopterin reductase
MGLEFSVGFGRDESLDQIAEEARLAEELGFDQMTLVDQQNLCRDVYVMMTIAAQNTSRIQIGHGVTVPETRHPSVTANATATVAEIAPGRIFLGIGAGGNALRSMGRGPRPMQEYREYTEFIAKYIRGEEAEFQGARMHNTWIREPFPIVMAATGPASCRMAGELADAVIIGPGVHPEVVKWRIEQVQRGAEKAGRDPANIGIWLRLMIVLAESREAARRQASAYASRGVWTTLGLVKSPDVAELYRRLEPQIADLDGLIAEGRRAYEAYDEYQHEELDSPHSQLVTQRMIDFVHLTGTPEDVSERIGALREIGVTNISVTTFTLEDRHGMLQDISETIMSRFR